MKLVIHTQIKENYGAHTWDGTGDCPEYWKFKGGNQYCVIGVTSANCGGLVSRMRREIEELNEFFQEYIITTFFLLDSELEFKYLADWEREYINYYKLEKGEIVPV